MMKRLLFSAFIMLFAGGLFAQVNLIGTDNVSPEVHADKVAKEVKKTFNLHEEQIENIKAISMDATAYMQSIKDLKTSNPAEYQQRYDKLVAKIEKKISGMFNGRLNQSFSELSGYSSETEQSRQ